MSDDQEFHWWRGSDGGGWRKFRMLSRDETDWALYRAWFFENGNFYWLSSKADISDPNGRKKYNFPDDVVTIEDRQRFCEVMWAMQ